MHFHDKKVILVTLENYSRSIISLKKSGNSKRYWYINTSNNTIYYDIVQITFRSDKTNFSDKLKLEI